MVHRPKGIGILLALTMGLFMLTPVHAAASAAPPPPEVSAQACILMEAGTGQVLCEKNGREKRPMASTTKIMTVLLTLESGDLDRVFEVDSEAIRVEGSSMGLREGDLVTRRALCWGMLLPSGNDAANAAAVSVAGSIEAFAERMNARAKEIGMTRTWFVTPSGLEGEGHGASAYDMALLAREALQNADFREMCASPSARVCFGAPPYERTLYNSNKLLGMYEGVIGVKTGFTDEAGRCLVSACERDGVTLICVTLNAPNDWQDHIHMYDHGFSRTRAAALAVPDGLSCPVVGGTDDAVALVPAETVASATVDGRSPAVETEVRVPPFLLPPLEAGTEVGTLVYRYDGRAIAAVPLVTAGAVAPAPSDASLWERFERWRLRLAVRWMDSVRLM